MVCVEGAIVDDEVTSGFIREGVSCSLECGEGYGDADRVVAWDVDCEAVDFASVERLLQAVHKMDMQITKEK